MKKAAHPEEQSSPTQADSTIPKIVETVETLASVRAYLDAALLINTTSPEAPDLLERFESAQARMCGLIQQSGPDQAILDAINESLELVRRLLLMLQSGEIEVYAPGFQL